MGGLSVGGWQKSEDDLLRFAGSLSLENNGGFSSIRSRGPAMDLSNFSGLQLRVRGDGRAYSLSVRTDFGIIAGAYYFDFDTQDGVWQDVFVPFEALQARSFGRALPAAPPPNLREIRSIGFIIADKQPGPFMLEVEGIKALRRPPTAEARTERGPAGFHDRARNLIERAINLGAPMYNRGQSESCAAIYEITARSLCELSPHEVPVPAIAALRQGLISADGRQDHAQRAWDLRHALDAALANLTVKTASAQANME
jgi:monofunctional biosynthetic peptidoglycan transglycosylase